jgi:hypothetical protein
LRLPAARNVRERINAVKRGASIRIFLADGTPQGLRLVEKSNWTGHAVVCPRARFADVKSRREFNRPGVYVLVGPAATAELPVIYVGEGDPVRPRLEQHHREKDFWTSVVLFTSSAENLNKAHVQYLESRLIELAKTAKRCDLENGNTPQRPNVTEADQAEMESFLDDMLLVYPVVGVNAFDSAKIESPAIQRLMIKAKGITATGYDTPAGFVVTRGSEAVTDWVPSAHKYALALWDSLIDRGVLVKSNDRYVFTQDYTFDSPSAAAQIVQGRTANGRIDWKDDQGRTLKELQERSVPQTGAE